MPYEGTDTEEARLERQRVERGELPQRYAEPWGRPFFLAAAPVLREGVRILDVGSGRAPTIPREARPPGTVYIGQDVSAAELDAAPAGSYDGVKIGDVGQARPDLVGRFDLIVSWQVLEHVASMEAALEAMRSYLVPGGRLVALLSGSLSPQAILARAIPYRASTWMMERLLGVKPEEKFPTHYDHCSYRELDRLLSRWSAHGIEPRYKAGAYFRFARPIERSYLAYENWIDRTGRRHLATHYVIWADR